MDEAAGLDRRRPELRRSIQPRMTQMNTDKNKAFFFSYPCRSVSSVVEKERSMIMDLPICDVCGEEFIDGQTTEESCICEDCLRGGSGRAQDRPEPGHPADRRPVLPDRA